jgi:hypothetical protein
MGGKATRGSRARRPDSFKDVVIGESLLGGRTLEGSEERPLIDKPVRVGPALRLLGLLSWGHSGCHGGFFAMGRYPSD